MSQKGRAAVFYELGRPIEIKEYPLTEPEPGAAVIKVSMSNICGSDMHIWRGEFNVSGVGFALPRILGHEMTGRIHELGEGVNTDSAGSPLAVGDRVVYRYFYPCGACPVCQRGFTAACKDAMPQLSTSCEEPPHFKGAYGEYYYLQPRHSVFKVPDELSDEVVAPINCALSEVIFGLERVDFRFGETIVIQGAGGLGVNMTAVAKEMGAGKIIVVEGIPERIELALAFGADEIIDMRELPQSEDRVKRVKELTAGWGADVVAELAGTPNAVPEGLSMLGTGGRYMEVGNVSPGLTYEADPAVLVWDSKSIIGVKWYETETLKKALEFLVRTKGKYPFDKVISHKFPLEKVNEAFAEQDKGHIQRTALVMDYE